MEGSGTDPGPGRVIEPVRSGGLTRRAILKYIAAGTAGAGVSGVFRGAGARPKIGLGLQDIISQIRALPCSPNLVVNVLRREDLLNLRFEFYNLVRQGENLVRQVANQPAYVVVQLAQQHITEQAFYETDAAFPGPEVPPNPPVKALLADPSRLAFTVPVGVNSIPFELPTLMDWVQLEQKVAPTAKPPESQKRARTGLNALIVFATCPQIEAPTCLETAIEAPWRLILSPNRFAGWAHAPGPVTHDGRTELWHTRLGTRKKNNQTNTYYVDEADASLRKVRAIWSPDFTGNDNGQSGCSKNQNESTTPFRMSLTGADRNELVRLTSDFCNLDPEPVDAHRLTLSALGAWMDLHGHWEPPSFLSVEDWTHKATMGRDAYVRVVYKGFLFPFGHRAALIKVTERKFHVPANGQKTAYLRQRMFIVVREPNKDFTATTFKLPFDGLDMAFKRVRIATQVTPNLDPPNATNPKVTGFGEDAFWPQVAEKPFAFHVVGTDWDGQRVEFTMPLIFVKNCLAFVSADMDDLRDQYNALAATNPLRHAVVGGQKVAFAKTSKPGDTALETDHVVFGAAEPEPAPEQSFIDIDQPLFYPYVQGAKVRLQAAEQVKGGGLSGGTFIALRAKGETEPFDPDANAGGVFCRTAADDLIDDAAKALGFDQSDRSGGLATPNMAIAGLSRSHGPVGGALDTFKNGSFDPAQFLDGAKFLGGLNLYDVIKVVAMAGDGVEAPKIVARNIHPNDDKSQPPTKVEVKLTWKPAMQKDPLGIFEIDPYGTGNDTKTTFDLLALFTTDLLDTSKSAYEITGDLRRFRVNLFGDNAATKFIALKFKRFVFKAQQGTNPDCDCDIDEVKFEGVLKFVETLKDYLNFGGSGLAIDPLPTRVTASLSIGLPTITVGLFTLSNMSFAAGVNIPFTGEPVRARFGFCSREAPFMLVYTIFGGGGFFAIELGVDGVELFEMALEFGAGLAMDIGVASGQVKIVAGVYFKIESGDATLTGYVQLNGCLEILGIISLSLEFYLGLTYDFPTEKATGQCTLTVKVEVLLFSASVSMTVEKKFGGSGDPSLLLLMPPRDVIDLSQGSVDFDEYAAAFATAKTPASF